MEFKDRFNQIRTERNLSFAEVASRFHKSESAVRAWEAGRTKPDADTLIELADYFKCSTDYLLGLDDIKNKETFQKLGQQFEEFSDLLSRVENPEHMLQSLIWILDTPYIAEKVEVSGSLNADVISKSFGILVTLMAHATNRMVKIFVSEKPADVNAFSSFSSMLNADRKVCESSLALYFSSLMDTAAEHIAKNSEKEHLQLIENIRNTFIDNIDLNKVYKELLSATSELDNLELIIPVKPQ